MIPSVALVPLSGEIPAMAGEDGPIVSSVATKIAEDPEPFPAASVAVAVKLLTPSARMTFPAVAQLPLASAATVATRIAPS